MKNAYKVVVIGAGVGGLTCGCYLAKAGLKVLIVEQHDKSGGYCTSFTRKGYRFDVGVHSLGGKTKGIIGRVFKDLDLDSVVKVNQFDPVDRIIMPDKEVYLRADPQETILELKKQFPAESNNIERFFRFIMQDDFLNIYKSVKKATVKELLDNYFGDNKIKYIFNVLLRNLNISAGEASALCFIIFLREYVLDPGYYPVGGIQSFPDGLTEIFKSFGGEILFCKRVASVMTENNEVSKIVLNDGIEIKTNIVVSNSDATTLFKEMLDVESKERCNTDILKPSISGFAVYLGLKDVEEKVFNGFSTTWPFTDFAIDSQAFLNEERVRHKSFFLTEIAFSTAHDLAFLEKSAKISMGIFSAATYSDKKWWVNREEEISDCLVA
ncbi:MAG: NAD(P)/FAD-dependent oxidoreductase, partial [Candidatus Omnitrophota bacterium]